MKSKLFGVLLFTAGAAVGSVVTWKYLTTKYNQLIQEEIDSVKETFGKMYGSENDEGEGTDESEDTELSRPEKPVEDPDEDPQDHMMRLYEYESEIARLKYASVSNREEGEGEPVILAPYVISPDNYGEDGYETSMLTYYSDGVLEDDYWNIVMNPDDVVGDEFMNHFDEYTENTVYIRNEELKTDYEITRDKRTYEESQAESPYAVTNNA